MVEIFKGARVVDPQNGVDEAIDIKVEEGVITEVGKNLSEPNATLTDLSERVVVPGVVDMHVHLREPGTRGETIFSGSKAALRGGVTTLAAMPNTQPAIDDLISLRNVQALADQADQAKVVFIAALTKGREGKNVTEISRLKEEGAVAFSDDGSPVCSAEVMRRAMLAAQLAGSPVINHCEDCTLAGEGVMNEGAVSLKKGLKGQPHLSESVMVGRDILLAKETNCHYHVAHVSAESSLKQLRFARDEGIRVTSEVTPHHFILADEDIPGYNTNYKMNPPLRTRKDVDAMVGALQEGLVGVIASDHAPHPGDMKSLEFQNAPFGIMGVETMLLLSLKYLVARGHMSLSKVIACLTTNPAKILGLNSGHLGVGAPADFVVLDMNRSFTYQVNETPSKSRNTPFDGETFDMKIEATYLDGQKRFENS